MKYAIKFWSQAPETEDWVKDGVPGDWPYKSQQISESNAESFKGFGWTVMEESEFQSYLSERQSKFDNWFANRSHLRNTTRLKVLDLVDEKFKNYHPAKIDFTIHLKPNVVLNKKVTMLKNGRPEKAEYSYNGAPICEIRFEFQVNAQNFVTRRTEKLCYIQGNGQKGETYLIKDKIYDMTNFSDRAEIVEERSDARQYIMKEIKAVLNDVLGYYFIVLPPSNEKKTPKELWKIAGDFWSAYSSDIDSWYNTATEEFKNRILADDTFDFLNLIVPPAFSQEADAKTVRQYIINRITY